MRHLVVGVLSLVLVAFAAQPDPLWNLNQVADLSNLLYKAQGKGRKGFLDMLAEGDPEGADDDDTDDTTAEPAEDDETGSAPSPPAKGGPPSNQDDNEDNEEAGPRKGGSGRSPSRSPGKRNGSGGQRGGGGGFPGGGFPGGGFPGGGNFSPLETPPADDADKETRWFNAQAFIKWLVRGLTASYEGLVHLMLTPLRIIISILDS